MSVDTINDAEQESMSEKKATLFGKNTYIFVYRKETLLGQGLACDDKEEMVVGTDRTGDKCHLAEARGTRAAQIVSGTLYGCIVVFFKKMMEDKTNSVPHFSYCFEELQ